MLPKITKNEEWLEEQCLQRKPTKLDDASKIQENENKIEEIISRDWKIERNDEDLSESCVWFEWGMRV